MTVKMSSLEQKLASSQRIYNQPVTREEGRHYFLAQGMLIITKSRFQLDHSDPTNQLNPTTTPKENLS